jgi:GTP-binding protein
MIVGYSPKPEDIRVNVCKKKHVTNMRSSNADDAMRLTPARKYSLEECLEFLADDEKLEVTPKTLRMRKSVLEFNARVKSQNQAKKGG